MNNILIVGIIFVVILLFCKKNKVETFIEDREDGNTYIAPNVQGKNVNISGNVNVVNDLKIQGKFLNKHNQPFIPRGMIVMWAGLVKDIPTGWALCDGSNGTPNLLGRFIASIHPGQGGWKKNAPHNPPFGSGIVKLHPNHIPSHSHTATITSTDTNHQHTGRTNSMNRNSVHSHHFEDVFYSENIRGHPHVGVPHGWGSGDTDRDNVGLYRGARTHNTDTNHEHDFRTSWMDRNNAHTHGIKINNYGPGHAFDVRPYFYVLAFIMKL